MDWRLRSMRRPAFNEPGHAHELTFNCFRRHAFLSADRTCQWLADAINDARISLDFALWAYVFMPEHVHLMMYPKRPVYDIQAILQAIKHLLVHAPEWLRRITVRRGKRQERRFWQAGGGYDRNVFEPKILLAMIDYIHGNPVRRGLVMQAELWKWSSAAWFEGKNSLKPDPIDFGGLCVYLDGRG
jgi:putative transposase